MIAKLGKSCCLGYLLRMATTGSIRAACLAGTNPAITPTNMQIPMARNIFAVEMKTGKFGSAPSLLQAFNEEKCLNVKLSKQVYKLKHNKFEF
jgi:hypothetical protein